MIYKRMFLIAVLLGIISAGGCKSEPVVKNGDTVKVDYTGTLDDGSVFDSSKGRTPLEFMVGGGGVISGFDSAVLGMKVGETKTVHIPIDEAYGQSRSDLIVTIPRSQLPDVSPEVGQTLTLQQPNGRTVNVKVTKVTLTEVTLDLNHPLAGKDLNFEITVIEIIPAK